MKERKASILKAIVRCFIQTASPVGSKCIHDIEKMEVSAATIRNEMANLEDEGFLRHPHTSAGRIPTASGYRFYVEGLDIPQEQRRKVYEEFSEERKKQLKGRMADQRVFDAISILTKITPNIAFATVPSSKRTFFLGISNVLKEPELSGDVSLAAKIISVLEVDLYEALQGMNITEEISLFIGPEIYLEDIRECSLITFRYSILDFKGIIGILGPMRMPYAKNILALEAARAFLSEKLLESSE